MRKCDSSYGLGSTLVYVWITLSLSLFPNTLFSAAPANPSTEPHWSLQALLEPAIPTPKQTTWAKNPIDRFILARLEQSQLTPSPTADAQTLIRRLSFDLIGLPPTPAEVETFVHDPSPKAYERLVERLLASPHFGERWGRHWLDIVRYTESQGFEYDKLRDNAWHYRDYVIQSFNQNKPYDVFMREQIAGDVIEPVTPQGMIATSLLVCGPWDEAGNAQANVAQRMATREEELEDVISVVSQTFLGLTVNCARCHNHKFDPIPQTDYYRLKSVFEGVRHGERIIVPRADAEKQRARENALKEKVAELEQEVSSIEWEGARDAMQARGSVPASNVTQMLPLKRWEFQSSAALAQTDTMEGGAVLEAGRLQLYKPGAFFRSEALSKDVGPKTLEAWVSLSGLAQQGGAAISIETQSGGTFDAIVFGERQARRWTAGSEGFVRTKDLNASEESTPSSGWVHMVATYAANGEIALYRDGVRYGSAYSPSKSPKLFPAGKSHVLLGMRHTGGAKPFLTGSILSAALYDRSLTSNEVASLYTQAPWKVSPTDALAALRAPRQQERLALLDQVQRARSELSTFKPLPVSYVGNREQPSPTHKLKRGDTRSPEEVVSPGGLAALIPLGVDPDLGLAADAPEAHRRVRFAEWLTHTNNPLPARVMMNRLWQFHLGSGIAATPNDLGKSGSAPTHPALLDWLARRFVESHFDLKAMHRLIVNSATYRQSSDYRQEASTRDADNAWLWRYSPRRLEAETLRDAMLMVSDEINLTVGGSSFRPFNELKFPSNSYEPADKLGPEFNRRSVYRMNVNSGKEPMLDVFDCPDPAVKSPRRGVTTTPLQALALMNNSFVQRQANHLAERALSESGNAINEAIHRVYERCLGRHPSPEELARSIPTVQERGLPRFCWAMLNTTEFMYVR